MKADKIKFWREEMDNVLDPLYKEKRKIWQGTLDLYDLKFDKQIRDLNPDDLVRISRLYPIVRQIIASVAFNYPKVFFEVTDDEAYDLDINIILERQAEAALGLMKAKPHVQQTIFDALTTGVGWLGMNYNPKGDDMIAPYVANDAMAEDFTCLNRLPPGFVQLDPTTPPHMLGHARYIRERMYVPLDMLMEDKEIKNKNKIKAVSATKAEDLGFGDVERSGMKSHEQDAIMKSVSNGQFTLIDRIHDRMEKTLITFAEGVEEPVAEREHPFRRMMFPQAMDSLGQPIFEDDGMTPVLDLDGGRPGVGWIVDNGFGFIPVKFDLSHNGFYPKSHLSYLEDIQYGIVESMSRQAAALKRTSRQMLINRREGEENPEVAKMISKGEDGGTAFVEDHNNFNVLNWGNMPPEQYAFEDRLKAYEEEISRVTELGNSGGPEITATEAALRGSVASVNRESMTSVVAKVYEDIIRMQMSICGDPRYTPENHIVNVAPAGQQQLSRALRSSDFLWNYKMHVQAASVQPLFAEVEQKKTLEFYDRGINSPNFERLELDKMLAATFNIPNVSKVMVKQIDEEATRAAQLENDRMISQMQDPGITPKQNHKVHMETHGQYQQNQQYQQLMQQAQATDERGVPVNPQAAQMIQYIDQIMQGHQQAHQQAEQERAGQIGGAPKPSARPEMGLDSTVRSNAQDVSNSIKAEGQDEGGGRR